MENQFHITFTANEEGELLRDALFRQGISKRALTAIKFKGGLILVNGKEENVRYKLKNSDQVTIIFPTEEISQGLVAEHGPLNILYEDKAILIVNKPPFMSTIPSREHPRHSLANYLVGYFKEQGLLSTIHIVTRLDRDTSGLVCIAKHRHVHHLMGLLLQNQLMNKQYEAIVHGHIKNDEQSIIAPIGRKDSSVIEREVRNDGQFAHTDVTVLKRTYIHDLPITHVRLHLHTGRTHQIRVHLAHIGHPLIGDDLYGGSRKLFHRHALHCVKLEFPHPLTKQNIQFLSDLPYDMKNILK